MLRCYLIVLLVWWAPSAPADDNGEAIAERFQRITAGTRWERVDEFAMDFDTYHPQGMAIVGERIYISSVEVIDRAKGRGRGHIFETDMRGKLLRRMELWEGAANHPGGMDFDGEHLWVPVAEHRPDSRVIVYTVDVAAMKARRVFEFGDHLGGIVRDVKSNTLIGNSWGSRRFYRWGLRGAAKTLEVVDAARPEMRLNSSHFIDYQDVQWLRGTRLMLCGGVKRYRVPGRRDGTFSLGGMALVDTETLGVVHEVPIPLWADGRLPMTQNPFYVRAVGEGLRFYFMPEDNASTVYVYEPSLGPTSAVR